MCYEILSVLLKHEIWTLKNKRASENVQQKIVQENKLPEIKADKGKLKMKTIRSTNSAELINQKRWWKYRRYLCLAFFVCFMFVCWNISFILAWCLYFKTPSVKRVNRHTNLYFSLNGHVHCVYVCVCKIKYYSVSRAYIIDNYIKIILCYMIRI